MKEKDGARQISWKRVLREESRSRQVQSRLGKSDEEKRYEEKRYATKIGTKTKHRSDSHVHVK